MRDISGVAVLAVPMQENDACADTVGQFLVGLLARLWDDGDSFDAVRPFGSTGWDYDLYEALMRAGLISGMVDDEFGYVEDVDTYAGDVLIRAAIASLGAGGGRG